MSASALPLVSPLTTPWPLESPVTPPLGVKPLGKLMVPVTLAGLVVFGTAPVMAKSKKSPAKVEVFTISTYRSVAVPPLCAIRLSTAVP